MTVDPLLFRQVLGRFATGVTVVTTCDDHVRAGITVNAFCSVSLDPPLVLVCIDHASRFHDIFAQAGFFAVNFLSAEQEDLSACFAGNTELRYQNFCNATSRPVVTGAPVLDGCLGFVDCRVAATYPGGDHTIILGQVEALGAGEGEPLLYYRSRYLRPGEGAQ